MTTAWQQISEACPRARWRKDSEADYCEQPGCSVRFGYFGMPGLSWSTTSSSTTSRATSASNIGVETTSSSPFTRTASLSSVESLSLKTSIESCSPTKGSPAATSISPSILASSLFAHLRLVDSASSFLSNVSNVICEEPSEAPPSHSTPFTVPATATSSTALAAPVPPSTPTLLTSPKSSFFEPILNSVDGITGRRHSASSTFNLPRSPIKLHRRHHCRRCGYCFCSDHSSHTATLILASEDFALSTIDEMSRIVTQEPQLEEPAPTTTTSIFSPANLFSSARMSSSPPTTTTTSHYIRARVCDSCYATLKRARCRLQDSPSPPQGNYFSGWTTPTIMEDDDEEEYFDSLERIRKESKREHHEALKVLCNDYSANRVVAKAVDGGTDAAKHHHSSPLVDCGQIIQSDFNLKLAVGPQLATAPLWEKVEVKRKNELLAKRAMSVDSLIIDEDEEDWDVDMQAVRSMTRQSIFDRRCYSRPPSPQPVLGLSMVAESSRRGSAESNNSASAASTSPLSCTLPSMSRMGATRLQRSFDSSQRSNHAKPLYGPRRASRPAG